MENQTQIRGGFERLDLFTKLLLGFILLVLLTGVGVCVYTIVRLTGERDKAQLEAQISEQGRLYARDTLSTVREKLRDCELSKAASLQKAATLITKRIETERVIGSNLSKQTKRQNVTTSIVQLVKAKALPESYLNDSTAIDSLVLSKLDSAVTLAVAKTATWYNQLSVTNDSLAITNGTLLIQTQTDATKYQEVLTRNNELYSTVQTLAMPCIGLFQRLFCRSCKTAHTALKNEAKARLDAN